MKSGQTHFKVLSALVRTGRTEQGWGRSRREGVTSGSGFWIASVPGLVDTSDQPWGLSVLSIRATPGSGSRWVVPVLSTSVTVTLVALFKPRS